MSECPQSEMTEIQVAETDQELAGTTKVPDEVIQKENIAPAKSSVFGQNISDLFKKIAKEQERCNNKANSESDKVVMNSQ